MHTTDSDIAWAAGLFEGEGSIQLYEKKGSPGVWLRWLGLGMCDEDVVRRYRGVVDCGSVRFRPRPKAHPDWRPTWYWQTGKWADITRLLNAFQPYLGERRWAKAEEMLSHPPAYGLRSHVLTDEQVRRIREMASTREVPQRAIAAQFGIDQSMVSRIHHGKSWTHVP